MKDSIKVLPIEHTSAIDKLIDYVPDLMEKANSIVDKSIENKDKNKIQIPHSKIKNAKKIKNIPTTPVNEEMQENLEENDYFGDEE